MKVFIENEAGSNKKNIFNEKTLEFKKRVEVSQAYPYPYGFVLDTTAEDGDNVDCFVITDQELETGDVIECRAIALMEQKETSWKPDSDEIEVDHNVIAVPVDEELSFNDEVKDKLINFVSHVFDHIPDKRVEVGQFLDFNDAQKYIAKNQY